MSQLDLPPFSVLLPVYAGDRGDWLQESFHSIARQTCPPAELVVVVDGRITDELSAVIEQHRASASYETKRIDLPKNLGLGLALARGLAECTHDIVARCDADDINLPDRFRLQLEHMEANRNLSVLGGQIAEFTGKVGNSPLRLRMVPVTIEEVASFARFRNPVNHMTAIFRRSAVQSAGGYVDMKKYEDYYLWLRIIAAGGTISNLPVPLVLARTSEDFYVRRSGWGLFRSEVAFQSQVWRDGLLPWYCTLRNLAVRGSARLLPLAVVRKIYHRLLRSEGGQEETAG